MYGILLQGIVDYVQSKHGKNLASKILQLSEGRIIEDEVYSEEFMDIVLKEIYDKDFYGKMGGHLVHFLKRSNYDVIFLSHWSEYRDFLRGLDKYDEYLKAYYPKMTSPLFILKEETINGIKLECYSKEKCLIDYSAGLLQEVGQSFFKQDFQLDVFEEIDSEEGSYKALFEFSFDNRASFNTSLYLDQYDFVIEPALFGYVFPYSMVISSCMKIISSGVSLLSTFPDIRGQVLSDIIILQRPDIILNYKNVLKHLSNVYDFIIKDLSCGAMEDSRISIWEPTKIEYGLRLKGKMIFLEPWNMFIFIATPVLSSLSSLRSVGLNISHLAIHDYSRDLMLAEAQQTVELKMTYDQGQEKQTRLEVFLDKLDEEMKRTLAILHEMVPEKSALEYHEGGSSLKLLQNVSVLISDIVKFTTVCSFLKPMEVVTALNTMYSKFDLLTAKHGVYKVETIGDAYMIVSSISVDNCPEKICDMALDMKEAIKDVLDPKTGAHLNIRIGIHTGPVVAGVVGLKVPKFCLFGSTVKIAVLLEASSQPMKIKISQSTKEFLTPDYIIEKSDPIAVKNGEEMNTFWLISKTYNK